MRKVIRLGSRGSPLALVQANLVKTLIAESLESRGHAPCDIQIVPITTKGDWKPEHKERRFVEMGGNKGLFTKEIEESLFNHHIDLAVHSMKDVASCLPLGLEIAAILEREDPRDAFISPKAATLDELPAGSTVGTSSLRRQSQILARRPDLKVTALRGNVETRLKKIADGMADATLLAVAGLTRLKMTNHITSVMPTDVMLPAGAQGAVGVEIRSDDAELKDILAPLNSLTTSLCVRAERAMLCVLDANCLTPIGVYAQLDGDKINLEGLVAHPDGTNLIRLTVTGSSANPEAVGEKLAAQFQAHFPADFFTH